MLKQVQPQLDEFVADCYNRLIRIFKSTHASRFYFRKNKRHASRNKIQYLANRTARALTSHVFSERKGYSISINSTNYY